MGNKESLISRWAKEINWDKRVKAVCKPCWELKYCPYEPLVERFPAKEEWDEKSCRIFGHDCPVFYTAEPFSETKELRRITRNIPRPLQFKVLKRQNQICDNCGKNVKDEDAEFDHIIPWSKGGPTEEHNIRLLCSECNKKRGNKFEDEYLVNEFTEHMIDSFDVEILEFVQMLVGFGHEFQYNNERMPTARDYADNLAEGDLTPAEHHAAEIYNDLKEFFDQSKPKELQPFEFEFLKHRWVFVDNKLYYLKELCKKYDLEIDKAVQLDNQLMKKLGLTIKNRKSDLNKWKKY